MIFSSDSEAPIADPLRDLHLPRQDVGLARRIHRTLLPGDHEDGRVEWAVRYHEHEMLGGDYCTVRYVGEGRLFLTVCDVTGHGLPAALVAGRIVLLDPPLWSSPRRFRNLGSWRTSLLNAVFILLFYLGVSPHTLHRWYYRERFDRRKKCSPVVG